MANDIAIDRIATSMPELNLEPSLRSKREVGNLLGVHGPHTPRGKQIADGLVRLVEKAVLEYEASREQLIAFLSKGELDDYYRAEDHFETSIHSVHRAVTYLERLRSMGFRQSDGLPFIPRPRELEILRNDVKTKIRVFRDFAEHLDQDIIDGTLAPDAEVGIHMGWEKATLNGVEVIYTELARWITQLHHFASVLSRINITVGPAPSPEQSD